MTKRFLIREEVTDCNVGDVLKFSDGIEIMCTAKNPITHECKVGERWYDTESLPSTFYTIKEVYPECSECGIYYKDK